MGDDIDTEMFKKSPMDVSRTPADVTKASKKETPADVSKMSAGTLEATAKVQGGGLGAAAKPVTGAAPVVTPPEKMPVRRLNLRIPSTVHHDLEAQAEKEGLTITTWVNILLANASEIEREWDAQKELASMRLRLAEAEKTIAGLKSHAASGEKSAHFCPHCGKQINKSHAASGEKSQKIVKCDRT